MVINQRDVGRILVLEGAPMLHHFRAVGMAVALLLAGSVDGTSELKLVTDPSLWSGGPQAAPSGVLSGRQVGQYACFALNDVPIIWPSGYSATRTDHGLAVRDETGRIGSVVGQMTYGVGGGGFLGEFSPCIARGQAAWMMQLIARE